MITNLSLNSHISTEVKVFGNWFDVSSAVGISTERVVEIMIGYFSILMDNYITHGNIKRGELFSDVNSVHYSCKTIYVKQYTINRLLNIFTLIDALPDQSCSSQQIDDKGKTAVMNLE